jgi:site-specific recombinase XerD
MSIKGRPNQNKTGKIPKQYEAFNDYLLEKGYSNKTISNYVSDAVSFVKWAEKENIPIAQTGYNDILHYIQARRGQVKQRTISTQTGNLKHYFNFLIAVGQADVNPVLNVQVKGVSRKTLYHLLSKAELENLYHHYPIPGEELRGLEAKRNKMITGLMVYQGLNAHELDGLTEKDMRLREGAVFIAGGRRSNERVLKLEAHQVLDMMEYALSIRKEILAQGGKRSGRLFVSTGIDERFSPMLQKLVKGLARQNSRVKNAKQVRSSVITHWLKQYNLRQVQQMAGHRFVSSTEAYLVNDMEGMLADIDQFHPIG